MMEARLPRAKGITQHFQRQLREYTDGIDNDLQVINEKIGQMEAPQISTPSLQG